MKLSYLVCSGLVTGRRLGPGERMAALFQPSLNRPMATMRSLTEVKAPRRIAGRVMLPEKISTMFNQSAHQTAEPTQLHREPTVETCSAGWQHAPTAVRRRDTRSARGAEGRRSVAGVATTRNFCRTARRTGSSSRSRSAAPGTAPTARYRQEGETARVSLALGPSSVASSRRSTSRLAVPGSWPSVCSRPLEGSRLRVAEPAARATTTIWAGITTDAGAAGRGPALGLARLSRAFASALAVCMQRSGRPGFRGDDYWPGIRSRYRTSTRQYIP